MNSAPAGLTPAWTQLDYHPVQSAAWRTAAKFVAIYAGRGSGKTELARRYIVRWLPVAKPWPDPKYFYALPTYNQARRVAWVEIKKLIPKHWIAKIRESDLEIETVFGSTLYVVGMDKPERIEGSQYDGGVIDESSDQKPGVFDKSIAPALTHRDPWCWRIGVPKRVGRGAKEFKEFCKTGSQATFTWPSSDILTGDQLDYFRETLSEVDFDEQFNASWLSATGAIFHAWGEHNIDDSVAYDRDKPIYVGQDFNVDPMCWCLAHEVNNELHIFDEVNIRNTNTQSSLDYLAKKYAEGHDAGWIFIGDASANARKTSAAQSDIAQIKNDKRFKRKRVLFSKSNPPLVDRFNACNALMKSASGRVRFKVHPSCLKVISDAEERRWKKDKREPDDGPDQGHMSDAFGYIVYKKWPVKIEGGSAVYAT